MKFIENNIGNHICIHAPTGFGKTPIILSSLLNFSKENGFKIIWCVRTGNETDRPIEELKVINKSEKVFGISFRGKKDMCFLMDEMKLEKSHSNATFLCKEKRKECKYYRNIENFDFEQILEKPLLYSEIMEFCKKNKICPYYVQRELLQYCNVISMNYNYIINEDISWSIRGLIPFKECFLVVDEAHNLVSACSNANSDKISLRAIENSLREIENFDAKIYEFINSLKKKIVEIAKEGESEFDMKKFLSDLPTDIIDTLNTIKKYGNEIRKIQLRAGKSPHSSLFHLSTFFLSALEKIDTEGVVFISNRTQKNIIIELWDMRSEEILKDRWKDFVSCVFCSGTLNPIKSFAETIGLQEYSEKTIPFTFELNNVKSFIVKGLSTKGEKLEGEMIKKYVECIQTVLELKKNTALFFSSYRTLNDIAPRIKAERIFIEEEGMSGVKARYVLDNFKKHGGVLCASMQGRFAEGADFPGKELEAIFLVGIPFDRLSIRTKLLLEYYKKLYGRSKGTYYGYVIPAIRRASQALGRALRSKDDKALFVLGDERYLQPRLFSLLPDYIKSTAKVVEENELNEMLK